MLASINPQNQQQTHFVITDLTRPTLPQLFSNKIRHWKFLNHVNFADLQAQKLQKGRSGITYPGIFSPFVGVTRPSSSKLNSPGNPQPSFLTCIKIARWRIVKSAPSGNCFCDLDGFCDTVGYRITRKDHTIKSVPT